jgi:hypothetical protein
LKKKLVGCNEGYTMKQAVLLCMVIFHLADAGKVFPFIEDFETFVTTTVPEKGRKSFKNYYEKLTQTINQDAPEQQCSTRRYFRQKALDLLEIQHHVWYEQIHTFLHDVAYIDQIYDHDRERLQSYLVWYGAYQEFDSTKKQVKKQVAVAKVQEPEKHTVVETTQSIMATASTKVKGWFSFFRS